jgi:hypothetical protein
MAVAHIDAIGEGPGFRKVRRALGVTAFGVNAIVLPPAIETGFHYHDRQEELYFVHRGTIEMEFGDGSRETLVEGAFARVDRTEDTQPQRRGRGVCDRRWQGRLCVTRRAGPAGRGAAGARVAQSRGQLVANRSRGSRRADREGTARKRIINPAAGSSGSTDGGARLPRRRRSPSAHRVMRRTP